MKDLLIYLFTTSLFVYLWIIIIVPDPSGGDYISEWSEKTNKNLKNAVSEKIGNQKTEIIFRKLRIVQNDIELFGNDPTPKEVCGETKPPKGNFISFYAKFDNKWRININPEETLCEN